MKNCFCGGPEEIYPHNLGTGLHCKKLDDRQATRLLTHKEWSDKLLERLGEKKSVETRGSLSVNTVLGYNLCYDQVIKAIKELE